MNKRDYILTPIEPIIPTENKEDVFERTPKKHSNTFVKINKNQVSNFGDNISEKFLKPEEPVKPQNTYSPIEIKKETPSYIQPVVQPVIEPVIDQVEVQDVKDENEIIVSNDLYKDYETKFTS